jgi:hypothetical protein
MPKMTRQEVLDSKPVGWLDEEIENLPDYERVVVIASLGSEVWDNMNPILLQAWAQFGAFVAKELYPDLTVSPSYGLARPRTRVELENRVIKREMYSLQDG